MSKGLYEKTKQNLLNTVALLIIGFACTAQPMGPHHDKREQIEAHKIAFITRHLGLTPEEAQVFWPVYNKCQQQQEELRKNRREQFPASSKEGPPTEGKNKRENINAMSDKEVEAIIDNEMVFRQKELDMEKECHEKYKQVLPIKKVAKLYRAEREFKRELLKRMQEHKEAPNKPEPPDRW